MNFLIIFGMQIHIDKLKPMKLSSARFLQLINTVFDLITAHAPISTQSSNLVVIRLITTNVLLFTKTYVVGTHLNCLDMSR